MKAKRLVALMMALVLVVGVFTMTAAALSEPCDRCVVRCAVDKGTNISYVRQDGCSYYNGVHSHMLKTPYTVYYCYICGTHTVDDKTVSSCPYE